MIEAFAIFLGAASSLGTASRYGPSGQNYHTIEYDSFGHDESKAGDRWSLVLVGPCGYGFVEADTLMKKHKLNDQVKILNWIPESDIPALMAGAAALVFPSLYEGFGIPILEAMATGTPVITSRDGAMAEVAGSAALLVNPRDVAAISHAMRTISTDESLASSLRTAGLARASGFSWQSTAQATWQVFHSALT